MNTIKVRGHAQFIQFFKFKNGNKPNIRYDH